MRSRLAALLGMLLVITCVTSAAAAPADTTAALSDASPLGRAERVLVLSVPTLTFADLERFDAPNIKSLLATSAVADLSVRAVTRRTDAVDGYATLNAGTRAEGTSQASLAFVAGEATFGGLDADGDPTEAPAEAFEEIPGGSESDAALPPIGGEGSQQPPLEPDPGERFDGSPAAEEFARRTGVQPDTGQVFNFGLVSMRQVNSSLLFGAEVGALGDSLRASGHRTAVVANADHGAGEDDVSYRREASIGLMNGRGLVDGGRVGRTLLRADPAAPFGTRFANGEVTEAFAEFWETSSVVLVEASDMVRYDDVTPLVLDGQKERLRAQAIKWSDELVGMLLEQIDPATDAVILVAPYAAGSATTPTVVGVASPAIDGGLLSSGTTRRDGFAQTVDVAPSVLSLLGVPKAGSMEGTTMAAVGGQDGTGRFTFLADAVTAAEFRDGIIGAVTTAFVLGQVALWFLAWWTLSRPQRRGLRTAIEVFTLSILFYLPATFLAGLFPFHQWGAAAFWGFLVGVSAAAGIAVQFLTRRYLVDPLLVTLVGIVGFLSFDILIGGPLQFNTVFGYTPTVAGRFNGMGNPAFSMLAAAAIIAAGLLAHRVGTRRGIWVAIAILGWCVVLDGAPNLGADVGGALTMIPAAGVTAWMLLGLRIKIRSALIWTSVTVAVVIGFGFLDLSRPEAKQTHLGRLLADIGDNGIEALQTVMLRKLNANLSVLTSSIWTLMVPLVFIVIGLLMWRAPWRLRTIEERIPEQRAIIAGLLTAMVLGFALNDSGISVPGLMLGVANASLAYLLMRVDDGLPSSPRDLDDAADPPPTSEPDGAPRPAEDQPTQSART